ncbi:MAG: HypC/HybG/HupF family hydrogenase formation chaperone [Elusimicrobia bacterium]|jgi:hydrogenase expression/formation protein HypC|nr:HypC/HybG/HupF family hydrogenase formation chaperone [Elusimicrobiota bacterium]
MCLAVPGRVVEIVGVDLAREAKVDFGGVFRRVSLAALPEAALNDFVLVHAGFAIAQVDEEEAQKTLVDLENLD